MSATKFVFFESIRKPRCGNKCGTLYSGARYVALWASCLNFILFLSHYLRSDISLPFLVHLSRWLKCSIVITRCPSSVRLSVRRPSLTFHIFDFFSETAEWIQRNLTGSKISTSSTKFVFFGPIGKTKWPPWPLIGWDIFDFSSDTAERNSTKLDRKQDLNVLYQVCVFWADRKNKMAALASDWLRHFRLLSWNRWTEFNGTWQEARSQRLLPSCVFRTDRKKKMAALVSDWLRHFDFFFETAEQNSKKLEARSQRLLPSLCFSGRWVNKNFRPGWSVKKVAHCTRVHNMWPFGPLVLSDISHILPVDR